MITKKLSHSFLLFSSFKTILSTDFSRQNLVFRPYAFDLLTQFLGTQNYTVADVENVATHGCWCGKLDPNNAYLEFLGGPDPVDELDEICKDWFKCRNCNDRLKGGSCNVEGISSREHLLSGEYTMTIDDSDPDLSVCSYGADTCSDDTCTIDLHYVKQIWNYVDTNTVVPIVVTNNQTCSASVQNDIVRKCEGTAPYLKPVEESGVDSFVDEGWETTGNDDLPVVFKLFVENVNWYTARDRCLALGNGASLAAIYDDDEANLVHNLGASVTAWIGGTDAYTEGVWEWETGKSGGREVMGYTRWSSNEPNQAGNEDCTEKYTNGRWNDINCNSMRGQYICQIRF